MDINFNKNEDHNKLLLSDLKNRFAQVKLGGGTKRIEKLHAEGKMTARERIDYLLDEKAKSIEIGAFVGDGMYKEHGGCPSGGVVVKIYSLFILHPRTLLLSDQYEGNPEGCSTTDVPNCPRPCDLTIPFL